MNEEQMRDADVPTPETVEELSAYIGALADRPHDYGTAVYAMSMAATAAFNYMARRIGATGFQASCADMDILRRTRRLKHGFQILNYDHLMYPQYCDREHFPSWRRLVVENKAELMAAARQHLAENPDAHPDVIAHWKWLADPQEGDE